MYKNMLTLLLLVITGTALAQANKDKAGYYLIPQAVLLNGDQSVSGQVQLVAGMEKKQWNIGLGTGIDYYKVRTIPLFIDLRACLGKARSLFAYADLGTNIAWPLESQYRKTWTITGNSLSSFNNGFYGDWGIGYSLKGQQRKGIVISLGYSVKTITEHYKELTYWIVPFPQPGSAQDRERKLDYTLNRITLKLGVRL